MSDFVLIINTKYVNMHVYFQNQLLRSNSKFICSGTASRKNLDSKETKVVLQLPAYLNLKYEQAGDYIIELSMERTADVEEIM